MFSFCIILIHWGINGFEATNKTLEHTLKQELRLGQKYFDTKTFKMIKSEKRSIYDSAKKFNDLIHDEEKICDGEEVLPLPLPPSCTDSLYDRRYYLNIQKPKRDMKKFAMLMKGNLLVVFVKLMFAIPLIFLLGVIDWVITKKIKYLELREESPISAGRFLSRLLWLSCVLYLILPLFNIIVR